MSQVQGSTPPRLLFMTLPVQAAGEQVLDLLEWALCRQCPISHRHPCPENISGLL